MKTLYKIALGTLGLAFFVGVFSPHVVTQTPEQVAEIAKKNKEIQAVNDAELKNRAMDQLGVKCIKSEKGRSAIGDTEARTLKCGWGKPSKINRTITANHTREQWVYGSGNYIYLTDGVVTSMQN